MRGIQAMALGMSLFYAMGGCSSKPTPPDGSPRPTSGSPGPSPELGQALLGTWVRDNPGFGKVSGLEFTSEPVMNLPSLPKDQAAAYRVVYINTQEGPGTARETHGYRVEGNRLLLRRTTVDTQDKSWKIVKVSPNQLQVETDKGESLIFTKK